MIPTLLVTLFCGNVASLQAGQAALKAFDYERAVQLLEKARREGPYRHDQYVGLFESLGVAYASLDRRQAAEAAFDMLLVLDPGHAIPYTLAPKVTFLFERVRRAADQRGPPLLEVNWPAGLRVEDAVPITVEVVADRKALLRKAALHSRRGDDASFQRRTIDLPPAGRTKTVMLAPPAKPKKAADALALYLVALDGSGNEVLKFGDAERPRRITLSYVPPTPWYKRWWVWAIAGGVVAAGAGLTGYLATREPNPTVGGVVRER